MSLINQVLEDLDKRRLEETNVSGVDDLRYAQVQHKPSNAKNIVLISLIGLAIVAAASVYVLFFNEPANQAGSTGVADGLADKSATASSSAAAIAPAQNRVTKQPMGSTQVESIQAKSVETKPVTTKKSVAKKAQTIAAVSKSEPVQSAEPVATGDAGGDEAEDNLVAGTPFKKQVVPLRTEQKAELAYQAGYDQLKSKRSNQAEQSLRRALAMEPDHIKARELLSGIFIKQGRWVEASEILRKGVELTPDHRTFNKLYARSLMQLGRDANAIKVLERSRPRVQEDPNHFAILAALYQRQGSHALAADTYASILKVNSSNGVWWVGLGISLEAMGRSQEASQAYAHARKTGNLQAEVSRFTDNRLLALEEMQYPSE